MRHIRGHAGRAEATSWRSVLEWRSKPGDNGLRCPSRSSGKSLTSRRSRWAGRSATLPDSVACTAEAVGEKRRESPSSGCGQAEYAGRSYIGMKRTASAGRRSSGNGMSTKRRSTRRRSTSRFVVCIENARYPASLELHKIYRILPDPDAARDGDVRIVDESGEDYLYPAEWFAALELPRRVKSSLLRRSPTLQSA
jgi:hypothetical protein